MLKVFPSILSCDFGKLRDEIVAVEKAGADGIHIDVMDGHFVPNLTLGAPIVRSISKDIKTITDCHLMVKNPEIHLKDFAEAGADYITVHEEACPHLQRTLKKIRDLGVKAGVSLNPHTRFETLEYVLDDIDMVLCMTVNPGFGGQKIIPAALRKAGELNKWLHNLNKRESILIQIDGGVSLENSHEFKKLGIDIIVAGSAVFSSSDYSNSISKLKG